MTAATTLDECVDRWRSHAWRTDPLTSEEWRRVREAIDDSYRLAGAARPAAVIRVRSPREAMSSALAHQNDQAVSEVNAATRIVESIREHELTILERVRSFSGSIASRVNSSTLSPRIWGAGLHPHMVRTPCTGNLRPGVAAEISWLLDHGQVSAAGSLRQALDAIVGRCVPGPARLLSDLAFVSDMPTHVLFDEQGRPHNEAGPAIRWADGTGLNIWHGTGIPPDFFRWGVERALAEVNVEVRRCAFEHIGVDRLEKSLKLLAEAPDPANPPHVLRLYDLPRPWLSGRLLVVDNASVDKGGHRRRFQIFVPPHITDPVEAAANSFGMTTDEYALLERAT